MKALRRVHLYLGCLFAPLILYFCVSGTWQLYRLNDLPKGETPTATQSMLHALSNPHTHSAFPGRNPREAHSGLFDAAAVAAAAGMVLTALLGVVLALRFSGRPALVWLCLGLGAAVPLVLLVL